MKLQRDLGDKGVVSLLRLYAYACKKTPDGVLFGMSPGDIALAAGWDGQPEEFVAKLVKIGWLRNFNTNTTSCLAFRDWRMM